MYVALRELRAARGRFAMITVVVVLVAILVTFVSGLAAGLRHQNVSAVDDLPGTSVIFADNGAAASFDESQLTAAQVTAATRDEQGAVPVGIARAKLNGPGHAPMSVAVFGMPARSAPQTVDQSSGTIRLSTEVTDELGLSPGDRISLGEKTFTVAAAVGDQWYSHSPVVYISLSDWQALNPQAGAATVVTADAEGTSVPGTMTVAHSDIRSALASYNSENGSLQLMTVMLFIISALVVGSFFVVWTVQRIPDIATLKALGASTSSLVRDSLAQAALVLIAGAAVGTAIAAGVGAAISSSMPFVSDASTTLLPAALIVVLGLAGSVVALRFLVTTDPLTALGGQR